MIALGDRCNNISRRAQHLINQMGMESVMPINIFGYNQQFCAITKKNAFSPEQSSIYI
jgi:hypothetical protein